MMTRWQGITRNWGRNRTQRRGMGFMSVLLLGTGIGIAAWSFRRNLFSFMIPGARRIQTVR